MQKRIYILFKLPLLTILVLVGFFIMLPQLNNQDYISATISSKLIFFLYGIVVLLGFYTLRFVFSKTITISCTKLDFALLLLLVYISLNRYFIQSHFGFSIRYLELLGLGFLYVVLRSIVPKNYPWLLLAIVLSGIIQAMYGILQLLGYFDTNHSGFKMTGSFFNPGPYAGFLISVWTVALGLYLFKDYFINQVESKKNSHSPLLNKVIQYAFEYIPLLGLISILTVLPASQSRAAWISGVVGSIILLELRYNYCSKAFQKVNSKLNKTIVFLLVIGIVVVGLFSLYHYKKSSSDGRAFIWKITTEIIANNAFFGVGFDRFKAHYMNYQADYFAINGEILETATADNTYYAFNEGLQFVAENGFLGLVLLLFVIQGLLQTKAKVAHKTKSNIAKTGLLTIGVFACFSYPTQILPVKIVTVALMVLLSNVSSDSFNFKIGAFKNSILVYKSSFILLACMVTYQTFSYTQNLKQGFVSWKNAMNNYYYGDYNAAIKEFETTYPVFNKDGEFLMNYGKALSIAGMHHKAIAVLEQTKEHQNNTIIATALGDSYKAAKQFIKAEVHYKQAINMIPSKFYAPYLLAKLYDEFEQKEKAVTVAQQILNKKIKVHSTAIEEIKIEMKQILTKYKNPSGF